MARLRLTLAQKALIVLILALLPILAVFYFTYQDTRRYLEEVIFEDLRVIAEGTEKDIDSLIDSECMNIETLASEAFVTGELKKISGAEKKDGAALSGYLKKNKLPMMKNLSRITAYSPDGKVVASTVLGNIGLDRSGEEFFRRGKEGLYVSERKDGYFRTPEVAVSAPVLSSGRLVGVIAGFMPVEKLSELLAGIRSTIGGIRGQRTFEVYLVNKDGLMITESRFLKGTEFKQRVDAAPVRTCLAENREITGFYPDYKGVEVAGASMCLERMGWTLLVELDKAEALAPIFKVATASIATVIITLLIIGLMFAYFMRAVVGQLRVLAAASRELASGNYDVSVPVRSEDELGELSRVFNEATETLKERDAALKESEERFRAILDNTGNVVYLKDVEGRHIFVNRKFEEVTRYGRDQVYGKTVYDLFPREVADFFWANDLMALKKGGPLVFEEKTALENGTHTFISIKFTLNNPSGVPYAVCGISTDITDLKRSEDALRKSEEKYRELLENLQEGVWVVDKDAITTYVNPRMAQMLGYEIREMLGRHLFSFMDERAVKEAKRLFERRKLGIREQHDFEFVRKDGSRIYTSLSTSPVIDDSGEFAGAIAALMDVTERKKAEDELKRLSEELEMKVRERTAQLEEANRELESFSYSVAHDLKAPLRLLDGFSYMLIKKYSDSLDREGRDNLLRLRAASLRMGQIIDDLLMLSRAMRVEMEKEEVDLSAVATAVAQELKRSQPDRNVEFVIEKDLKAMCDRRLVRTMFENLLGNAWKFTSKKESARIEFGRTELKGKHVYFVRDNGAGFDMKYSERLFIPFQRLHSSDEFPGTGIGLATVARIIKRHGGRIWAEGETGKGAVFYFSF